MKETFNFAKYLHLDEKNGIMFKTMYFYDLEKEMLWLNRSIVWRASSAPEAR